MRDLIECGRRFRHVSATVVVSLLTLLATPASADPIATAPLTPQVGAVGTNGITVTGESAVTVTPDVAYLTVGVQSTGRTAREASGANATQSAAVVEAVTRAGVPQSSIRTIGLSLTPVYAVRQPGDARPPTISGYEASNRLEVTITTVTQAGDIFDAAVGAGANTAGSLRFAVRKSDDAVREALTGAARDARQRAEAIAAGLGVRITGVAVASDEGGGVVRPDQSEMVAPRAMAAGAPTTPIQAGELTFYGRVRVTFTVAD